MSIQKYLYLAVLIDTSHDSVCVAAVTKDTWDNHKMYDNTDDIEDVVARIQVSGYFLESSGLDFSFLDIIEKNEIPLTPKDAPALMNEIKKSGFVINHDFAHKIHEDSNGQYTVP